MLVPHVLLLLTLLQLLRRTLVLHLLLLLLLLTLPQLLSGLLDLQELTRHWRLHLLCVLCPAPLCRGWADTLLLAPISLTTGLGY